MKLLTGLYIYIVFASFLTIFNNLNNVLNPTIIVSLIGIASALLFFTKKSNFYFLAAIWIIVQIPFLKTDSFTLDLSQFLNIHFSIRWGTFSIGLNAQILLLVFIKQILLSEFLFKKITFKSYTENLKLTRDNEYQFITNDITSKKVLGKAKIELDTIVYQKVEFEPLKSEKVKKAGITLISLNSKEKIRATIEYKLNNI